MKYYSTRGAARSVSFREAAFGGLAPDGGLYMPEQIPVADMDEVERLAAVSYADMAEYLATLFFGDDIPSAILHEIVSNAYDFPCPLKKMTENLYTLELFHGPTFAFKDFGARFMGGVTGYLNSGYNNPVTVLAATSGDTGSAVAAGLCNVPGVRVVILYPKGKVSPLQEAQMTTLGENVTALRVDGCFDDCQALVKSVFNDSVFRTRHRVTSANSIGILRWIPQSFYYFYGWAQWKAATGCRCPDIVVPSGNCGNVAAGMMAARMGLPARSFVIGSNANDVVPEYLASGRYFPKPSVRTLANAMDVGAPSNFERILDLYGGDYKRICSEVKGFSFSDEEIRDAIRKIHRSGGYLSDPHSAVGFLAAVEAGAEGFYLSTAHCAKFSEVILDAAGVECPMPQRLAETLSRNRSYTDIENDVEKLKELIAG